MRARPPAPSGALSCGDRRRRVNLDQPYRKGEPLTKREKLLQSLASHIYASDDGRSAVLDRLRALLRGE